MAGKRAAASKISKDKPEAETSSEDEQQDYEATTGISRPGRKTAKTITSSNPFATQSNPFAMLQEPSVETTEKPDLHTQMRGLNKSFEDALTRRLQKEPDADLSRIFIQYEKHLGNIHVRCGIKKPEAVQPTSSNSFTIGQPSEANPTFGISKSAEMTKPLDSDNFPKPSGFSFGTSRPAETTTLSNPKPLGSSGFSFGASKTDGPSSGFNFGGTSATINKDPTPSEEKPVPFTFGTTKPSGFAFGGGTQANGDAPSSFSFNQVTKPFDITKTETIAPSVPSSFSFNPATNPFDLTKTETITPSAPSPFSFNPAAKPFESVKGETTTPAAPFSFSFTSPLPSFGKPSEPPTVDLTGEGDDDGEIPVGEEESFTNARTNTELIKTGAGEEDEVTVIEERCKLFVFEKERGWTDLGVVLFKANQRKDDADKCRILARTEGSGKIILNAWINEHVQLEHISGKREFTLLCVNQEAKIAKYLVRCKEAAQAQELCDRIISLKPTP